MAVDYTRKLDPEGTFTVGESRGLLLVMAGIFAALFIYEVADLFIHPDTPIASHLLLLAIVPAFFCFKKARERAVIMRINREGFVYYGKQLFTWRQFVSARVLDEAATARFGDNFKLMLQFYREDGNIYGRKIPLGSTQDKAEEEIIAAIRYYERLYQQGQ